MSKIEQVKSLLASLSREELIEARAYATLRLGVGIASPGSASEDDVSEMMIECICAVMRSRGTDMRHPPSVKVNTQTLATFRRAFKDGLDEFLRTAVKRNRVKLRALCHLSAELLCDEILRQGLAGSSLNAMRRIADVPSVLYRSFPGYAEAGLLHLVIREKEAPNVWSKSSDKTVPRRKGEATCK